MKKNPFNIPFFTDFFSMPAFSVRTSKHWAMEFNKLKNDNASMNHRWMYLKK
jgi:hypothetical protein